MASGEINTGRLKAEVAFILCDSDSTIRDFEIQQQDNAVKENRRAVIVAWQQFVFER